jgi:hypothetical protein
VSRFDYVDYKRLSDFSFSWQTAFGGVGLDEVVSFTTTSNVRSQRVMERLRSPLNRT